MNDLEIAALRKNYVLLSMYYQRPVDDAVIAMYVDDLQDLSITDVQSAMTRYRKDPKNKTFPLPAQLRELVMPVVMARLQAQATSKILLEAPQEASLDPKALEAAKSKLKEFYKRFGSGGHE